MTDRRDVLNALAALPVLQGGQAPPAPTPAAAGQFDWLSGESGASLTGG